MLQPNKLISYKESIGCVVASKKNASEVNRKEINLFDQRKKLFIGRTINNFYIGIAESGFNYNASRKTDFG